MGEWRGEKSAAGKKERCEDRSGAREGRVKSEKGKASNTTQQTCLTGQKPLLYEKIHLYKHVLLGKHWILYNMYPFL